MATSKILVVDNDKNVCEKLQFFLSKEGYTTIFSHNGENALRDFNRSKPDFILLDVVLPGLDGWQVCQEIRKTSNVPIIILTSKSETFDKVLGLELGADDYMVKPFEPRELLARIKAINRRVNYQFAKKQSDIIEYDALTVDISKYEMRVKGKLIDTPPKEIELLFLMASHPNKVYPRSDLFDNIWGFDYCGDSRTIDVHIKRLREKLDGASKMWSIRTVWGVGYKFELSENL